VGITTGEGRLKVHKCRHSHKLGAPGTVLAVGPDKLTVAFEGGSLDLLYVQPVGKKPMSWNDFANGRRLKEGERL
jgi:methionyl-tRNA formyltransferase